ncbi:hypothetical protein [Agrobacterium rubi]|uniref:hypothetical protein n=1 Tax=Agrobacterium rubi TaxID=28099 RepID=UPI0015747BE6|nr:hypothetical protein [Agrobacterium rubi]NTE87186.1 hypothetical protein [Agrobacterium rubi]NTF03120.1 hypothetical protein [Agrobacterium rubi]
METSQRIRANIAAHIGNLTLQQIEMQAIIEDQAKALADAVAASSKPVAETKPEKEA